MGSSGLVDLQNFHKKSCETILNTLFLHTVLTTLENELFTFLLLV